MLQGSSQKRRLLHAEKILPLSVPRLNAVSTILVFRDTKGTHPVVYSNQRHYMLHARKLCDNAMVWRKFSLHQRHSSSGSHLLILHTIHRSNLLALFSRLLLVSCHNNCHTNNDHPGALLMLFLCNLDSPALSVKLMNLALKR